MNCSRFAQTGFWKILSG